jgi:glutathione peroxidase-family protein
LKEERQNDQAQFQQIKEDQSRVNQEMIAMRNVMGEAKSAIEQERAASQGRLNEWQVSKYCIAAQGKLLKRSKGMVNSNESA